MIPNISALQALAETYAKMAVQAGDNAAHALHTRLASVIGEFRNGLKQVFGA
jgi:hypothetical protein